MKGILALEREINSSRTRLLKLRDAGRLGISPEALGYADQIAQLLKKAGLYAGMLRQYEVGRSAHDDSSRPDQEG